MALVDSFPPPSEQTHLEGHTRNLLDEAAQRVRAAGGDPDELLNLARLAFDVGDYAVAGITALKVSYRCAAEHRDYDPRDADRLRELRRPYEQQRRGDR